jgi:gamma-glutamylcyclotransferase (GGCT)/AIG2-like uncharacterized protein YtfP
MIRLFVYGTLRQGGRNHGLYLRNAIFEKRIFLTGFQMYSLTGYPFVLPDKNGQILCEQYLVSPKQLEACDLLELFFSDGHPDNEYDRIEVTNSVGEAGFLYVYADAKNADRRFRVENGDWITYYSEFSGGT